MVINETITTRKSSNEIHAASASAVHTGEESARPQSFTTMAGTSTTSSDRSPREMCRSQKTNVPTGHKKSLMNNIKKIGDQLDQKIRAVDVRKPENWRTQIRVVMHQILLQDVVIKVNEGLRRQTRRQLQTAEIKNNNANNMRKSRKVKPMKMCSELLLNKKCSTDNLFGCSKMQTARYEKQHRQTTKKKRKCCSKGKSTDKWKNKSTDKWKMWNNRIRKLRFEQRANDTEENHYYNNEHLANIVVIDNIQTH